MKFMKYALAIPLLAMILGCQPNLKEPEPVPLEGTWKRPIPGSPGEFEGIYFGADGHFGLIRIYSMSGTSWSRDGDQLTIGTLTLRYPEEGRDTLAIKRLTIEELVLEGDSYLSGSYRRDNGFGAVLAGKLLLPHEDVLPPDALLQVRLDEVTQADAEALMVGFQLIPVGGQKSPLAWRVTYATPDIRPDNRFAVSALLTFGNRLQYRTTSHYPAITQGAPRIFDMRAEIANPELAQSGHVMTGMYRYLADAGLFTDCRDGKRYPVAMLGENATLERRYMALRPEDGAEVWTRIKGKLIEQAGMEGDATETVLRVDEVLDVIPDKSCGTDGNPSLTGTRWKLIEVVWTGVGKDADLAQAELVFSADGRLGGSTGCNRLNTGYSLEGRQLKIGPLMTTRRACPGSQGELEIAVSKALEKVDGYEISDGILHLWHQGVPVLRYAEE